MENQCPFGFKRGFSAISHFKDISFVIVIVIVHNTRTQYHHRNKHNTIRLWGVISKLIYFRTALLKAVRVTGTGWHSDLSVDPQYRWWRSLIAIGHDWQLGVITCALAVQNHWSGSRLPSFFVSMTASDCRLPVPLSEAQQVDSKDWGSQTTLEWTEALHVAASTWHVRPGPETCQRSRGTVEATSRDTVRRRISQMLWALLFAAKQRATWERMVDSTLDPTNLKDGRTTVVRGNELNRRLVESEWVWH